MLFKAEPRVTAPKKSVTAASTTAYFSEMAELPTEVPQALAESLAPIANALTHITMHKRNENCQKKLHESKSQQSETY